MRKVMVSVVLMLLVAGAAYAELDFDAKSFYAQGLITLPTGDFGDVAGTGFGGGVGMVVPYSELLSFRGEAAYIIYGGEDVGTYSWDFGMIPFTVLGEYHMTEDSPAYFLGGVGLTMVRSSWEYSYTDPFTGQTVSADEDDSSSEFTLSLGGGYEVNEQIAVEGRFNIISDTNYISVHGTYAF